MSRSIIPDEIQEEILLRLPVQSILRFKSVCKNWFALLSSRKFIKDHLNLSATKTQLTNRKIMMGVGDGDSDDIFYSKDCGSILSQESTRCDGGAVQMDYPKDNNATDCNMNYIMGSCNGLILLRGDPSETLFLWNPSTREHKKIIKPPAPRGSNLSYGFGYDAKTDDYKLVCIATDEYDEDELEDFSEVYVYAAGSWSRRQNIPYACPEDTAGGVLLNGVLHWLGETVHWTGNIATREKSIITFDINSEKFMDLPFPDEIMTCPEHSFHVGVLGDYLCLVCDCDVGVDLWVMQKYGVRESWTRVTANPPSLKFCGSAKNCEMLIEAGDYLGLYDRKSDRVGILDLDDTIDDYRSSWSYVESLVSVTAGTMEQKQVKYISESQDPHLKKNSEVTMEPAADKEAKRKRNELAESNISSKRKRTYDEKML